MRLRRSHHRPKDFWSCLRHAVAPVPNLTFVSMTSQYSDAERSCMFSQVFPGTGYRFLSRPVVYPNVLQLVFRHPYRYILLIKLVCCSLVPGYRSMCSFTWTEVCDFHVQGYRSSLSFTWLLYILTEYLHFHCILMCWYKFCLCTFHQYI